MCKCLLYQKKAVNKQLLKNLRKNFYKTTRWCRCEWLRWRIKGLTSLKFQVRLTGMQKPVALFFSFCYGHHPFVSTFRDWKIKCLILFCVNSKIYNCSRWIVCARRSIRIIACQDKGEQDLYEDPFHLHHYLDTPPNN